MILQGRQLNRFTKLFESLMRFCATDLEVFGARRGAPMTDRDLAKVAAAVWGEDGDRSAIDRFLEANPDRLNRTDLREVATWREGFFESFNALRDGSNVYLITGTYAFAVRGLGYELDEDFYYMPTYVETLLLPFDGIITHGPTVSYLPEELSQAEQEMMRMLLEGCKSEGSVVRTSRQFQKLAPIALELARSVREEAEETPAVKKQLSECRILLAEDMFINAEIMKEVLKMKGMQVEHAENGQEALDLFKNHPAHYFDAVLMDLRMPVMDGLTAASGIRTCGREDSATIPIIALTANAFDEDVQRSLQAGMNAHLSKPVEPEQLYQTLEKFI